MLGFLLTAIIIELTPGPNMMWLTVLGATRGRAAALFAVAGVALGLALAGIVAGLGLTVLFDNYPSLITALRVAGTLYLFYLAYDAWTDADCEEAEIEKSNRAYFTQGLISNALNPKAYLFYVAILPQFLTEPDHPTQMLALLTAIYIVLATTIHAGIALGAGRMADWLAHSPQAKLLRRSLAVAIGAAAIWFFISTGHLV